MSAEVIKLKYLQYIVEALRLLYKNDRILFDKKTHEMTYEFRIANYLAQQLENEYPGMKIDCEYHSAVESDDGYKHGSSSNRVRPDIVFHDRCKNNIFCIEIKIDDIENDYEKVKGIIRENNYLEGYCICNITKNSVTVIGIDNSYKSIMQIYEYNSDSMEAK